MARFAPLAAAAGTELRAEAEPAVALVPRGRLEQVLVNLTRNALRAVADDGSAVVLFTRCEDEWAIVGVEDDGPGVPPDELARLFERFYRGRSTRDRQRGRSIRWLSALPRAPGSLRVTASITTIAAGSPPDST